MAHTEVVQQFMTLINTRPTDASLEDFLAHLTSSFDADYYGQVYLNMPALPSSKRASMQHTNVGGSYGSFFTCSTNEERCFKVMFSDRRRFHDTIKELFIQYVLSKDAQVGKYVPAIHGIYRADRNTLIVIEMDRLDQSLMELFETYMDMNSANKLSFANFYAPTKAAFKVLQEFNMRYEFVHRDFKINNIMFKRMANTQAEIRLIDFGMSCLTVTVNGTPYRIVCKSAYDEGVICRTQQDVSVYIMSVLTSIHESRMKPDLLGFINKIFIGEYYDFLRSRMTAAGSLFFASYNLHGNLFTNPAFGNALSLDRFFVELDATAEEENLPIVDFRIGNSAGGKRRRRRRTIRR
jgi:serine/threonine protein kinase